MPPKVDRSLQQMTMPELMARFFYHAQREQFLRKKYQEFRAIVDAPETEEDRELDRMLDSGIGND